MYETYLYIKLHIHLHRTCTFFHTYSYFFMIHAIMATLIYHVHIHLFSCTMLIRHFSPEFYFYSLIFRSQGWWKRTCLYWRFVLDRPRIATMKSGSSLGVLVRVCIILVRALCLFCSFFLLYIFRVVCLII